ncbi:MAG TPA: glycine betaine ABC transporter substrate-binding protein [Bryobacteraceae bacterium]|nr:glycine betaine ABC transporter substrate-binding protein [Bryobacteraceae bacterium]
MARTKTVACLILAAMVAGCSRPHSIVVGSKNFTEQLVLGEIIAQQLERRLGQKVERKLNLGGTLLAHQALVSGEIDVYPEYTGTALIAVLKQPPLHDPARVLSEVRSEYQKRWRLEWLRPFGFNNSFAMVIRGDEAQRGHLRTFSEAARYRGDWVLGVGYEFLNRADGFAGLVKTYGLRIKGEVKTMDLGLLYRALEQRQVDMIAANGTDGMLSVLGVTVLDDDQHYFPPYEAAPVAREEAIGSHPGLREALNELGGKLTNQTMRRLNYQVDGKQRALADVAREFLNQLPKQ